MNTKQNMAENEISNFNLKSLRRPVVSLESFFSGNEDESSIARNLDKHPSLPFFFELLQNIRNRADVEDVLVEITNVEIVETGNEYLFGLSDRVYIITSASREDISQWVAPLMPDDIDEGGLYNTNSLTAPVISEGNKMFALDWY